MDIYFEKIVFLKFYRYHFLTTDFFFRLFLASGDIREWEKLERYPEKKKYVSWTLHNIY